MKKLLFKLSDNKFIYYYSGKTVFKPNLTSVLLVNAIYLNKSKIKNKKILDLGCGSGVIGIFLKKKIFKNSEIHFADISKNAIKLTKKNCSINKVNYNNNTFYLSDDWKNISYNLVINDISAISSFFLKKKIWYNSYIPSDTGICGTKQISKFFKKIKKTNINNIVMPLISLADTNKINNIIKKNKYKISILLNKDWPIPNSLVKKESEQLLKLKKMKKINFKEQYGFFVANTKVLLLKRRT